MAPLLRFAAKHDVALLAAGATPQAVKHGFDGLHVDAGEAAIAEALKILKPDRIVGAGRLSTRDDAMVAGEAGADYVMFGEDGDGRRAAALIAWWAEVMEPPCAGFANTLADVAAFAAAGADFVALPPELWHGRDDVLAEARAALEAQRDASRAAHLPSLSPASPALPQAQTPPPTPPAKAARRRHPAGRRPADKPDFAYGAYQRGAFRTALALALKRLGDNPKDTAAMTLIGEIYRDGAAVKQDFAEATRWFRLASDLGDPQAAFELGAMLIGGAPGLPADRAGGAGAVSARRRQGRTNGLLQSRHRGDARQRSCARFRRRGGIFPQGAPRAATRRRPIPTASCCARDAALTRISRRRQNG